MKYGKVLTYNDIEEAKNLIGKKVISGDVYKGILVFPDKYYIRTLENVYDSDWPFAVASEYDITRNQFIREVIE